ncbi:porin family protein [Parapedobacter tibetensis]|uniref:porin family protein n=1 Tax=Parapedobacter tibetensis TaxID=2972951 RepID=UPI00214D4E33|nr:porin family protein [Parapedobacter tibetensis]
MKQRLFLVVMALLGSVYTLYAQNQFGIKAGVNLNFNETYESYDSFSQRSTTFGEGTVARFIGGVYASFNMTGKFYIQPELLYSQHYNIIEKSGDNWRSLREAKVDYLNIPVLIQYEAASGLKLEAGPQVGFPIYSPEIVEGGPNVIESMRIFNIGVAGGISYQIPNVGIGVFARYTEGLSNITKEEVGRDKDRFCSFGLSYAVSALWR